MPDPPESDIWYWDSIFDFSEISFASHKLRRNLLTKPENAFFLPKNS